MQIVIDIPEDVLKRTVFYREFKDLSDCITTIKALEKAITLPEHHGRLIDADDLYENTEICHSDIDGYACVRWKDINDAPTIIEGSDSE